MISLASDKASVTINPDGGFLHDVVFHHPGQDLRPLHRAPWFGADLPADIPVGLRNLAGDMFCAPFGDSDIEPAPPHGWTANGRWQLDHRDEGSAAFTLDRLVMGARVTKLVRLHAGHPWIYQRHVFDGGRGRIPVAYHAMLRAPGGAVLSFSPKAGGWTPADPLESDPARGRSALAYPQDFASPGQVALADGGWTDATQAPFAAAADDLLFLAEDLPRSLAWSSATAFQDGYTYLAVKSARVLPFTGVWVSNGGRSYPPWSGRHAGVIGIEECRVGRSPGHRQALASAPVHGHEPALNLGGRVAVAYAFTAFPAHGADAKVTSVELCHDRLRVDGSRWTHVLPFDPGWSD